MIFENPYSGIKPKTEKNLGKKITEQSGYIPPEKQIRDMIAAGVRLNASRNLYDFKDDKEDDGTYIDITRDRGIDMAEVSQMQAAAAYNLSTTDATNSVEKPSQEVKTTPPVAVVETKAAD